jgi:hypothetical protein
MALAWGDSLLAEVGVIQPFAHIVPHYNSPLYLCWHAAGYSWKTNLYGLTVDTVTAFELVLPNGKVVKVTEKDEDLWFALKVRLTSMRRTSNDLTVISSTGRTEQLCEPDQES